MKNRTYLPAVISAVCFFLIGLGCNSSDLKLKMVVADAGGLHEESLVYLVQPGGKTQAGAVNKLETANGGTLLHLVIDQAYRDRIRENAVFMVTRPVLSAASPAILVDALGSDPEIPAMDSGTTVSEISYAQYSLMLATSAMSDTFNRVMAKTEAFINEMGRNAESGMDALVAEIRRLTDEAASFSLEQKRRFEEEVLPTIKEKIDSLLRQFEADFRYDEKREQLEKEMQRLQNTLQV